MIENTPEIEPELTLESAIQDLTSVYDQEPNAENITKLNAAQDVLAKLIKDHHTGLFRILKQLKNVLPESTPNRAPRGVDPNIATAAFMATQLGKKALPTITPDSNIKSLASDLAQAYSGSSKEDFQQILEKEAAILTAIRSLPEPSYECIANIVSAMRVTESHSFPDSKLEAERKAIAFCLKAISKLPPVNAGAALAIIEPVKNDDGFALAQGNQH